MASKVTLSLETSECVIFSSKLKIIPTCNVSYMEALVRIYCNYIAVSGVASGRACRARHDLEYPDKKYESPFKVTCQPYRRSYVRENPVFRRAEV